MMRDAIMKLTKTELLQAMVRRGGSISLHPFIETGHYPLCLELVSDRLAVLSGTDTGVGSIAITDEGRRFLETQEETQPQAE